MKITLNGTPTEVQADTLAAVLGELGYGNAEVATAVVRRSPGRAVPGHRLPPGHLGKGGRRRRGGAT